MTALGIVADDLTGAMDAANGVAANGYETVVVGVPEAPPPEATVVALNTDSRYIAPVAAAKAVRKGVEAIDASTVYKKIDSTLRGNIGAEVSAALRATVADLAVVAPAFPATGRQTWNGIHTVGGIPVAKTEYATDEKGPTASTVSALFADQDVPVERIDGAEVSKGADCVATGFDIAIGRHDQPPIVVCDARTTAHLKVIASAGTRFDALFVGSGGLAAELRPDAPADNSPSIPEPTDGAPLAVVGSVSETTIRQLDQIQEAKMVHISPLDLLENRLSKVSTVADRLDRGVPTVLTAATERAAVDDTLAVGRDRGLSDAEIRERIAKGLARTAAEACRSTCPSGLFFTGGDVAVAGLHALGATTVSLSGATVDAGIPIGIVVDGIVSGTPLITKAGGFGEEMTIINCLATLDNTR